MLENYEKRLDISLLDNNPYHHENHINTRTGNENTGSHLIESTPNLPPTANTKTPVRSKTNTNERKISHNTSELESFISQWHNKLALENLKKDVEVEIKHQITQQLGAYCTTDLVKSLYEQIDILESKVYFWRVELREKRNLLKIIVTSKIPEAVDGFIQEKKQQKSLITTKENVALQILITIPVSTIIPLTTKKAITTTKTLTLITSTAAKR